MINISNALEKNLLLEVKNKLILLNPIDIASILETLSKENTLKAFRILSKDLASEVFSYLSSEKQQEIIESSSDEELKRIIDDMFLDDTVDLIEEMPAGVVAKILKNTSVENRKLINQFLKYPEDSAGSIMTVEYVSLKNDMNVKESLERIRAKGIKNETINDCFVIDKERKLVGTLPIRELIINQEEILIKNIMTDNFEKVQADTDREFVADLFRRYDLSTMAVVDTENRLVGIITIDDIVDVIDQENTEDFQKMAAMEPSDKEYLKESVFALAKHRILWLLILMISATATGTIIRRYEDTLQSVVVLAAFIPMLMDTGGNAGSQSSTLIIRGLALGEIKTKDVWKIKKLDIQVKQDLIRPRKTISFTGISQPEWKEEIKKAVYFQLRIESLETVKKELTAIRRFSRYLNEHKKNIQSCADLDRTIIEEYLVYMKTEDTGTKKYRAEITRLRSILNMVADIYQYPQVKDLILNRDIPPNIRSEFKVYSDAELKRFNEFLAKVDIQTARVMTIHQMLGTRISDTLTLRTDCLMEQNGEILIRIYQMKTHYYEKPISQELAALIREAIRYTEERYGKCKYIFTNENDHTKPMTYSLIQGRITTAIYRENLRDDNENYFTFGTHMYRHVYGVKLVEMHLDDWTIARLLGHKSLKNVKYYRKMSNQILANDTRKARNRLSQMVLECLDGWEEEYEQIRHDDSL